MTDKLTDRLFLILAALICSGLIVLIIVVVRPRFSEEWSKFIFASIGYLVVLISTSSTSEQLMGLSKTKILFFQLVFYVLTVSIAFLILKAGLLPLPKGGLTYVLPMTALSVLSLVVLDYLRKRFKFFKNNSNSKVQSKRDTTIADEDSKAETTDDSREKRMRRRFEYRDRH